MIAALFVRSDSIYKGIPGVDAWDIERDARKYNGPQPVVAHPPCRAWGRLRQFAKPRADEKECARIAVAQVRHLGGVLEHPECSSLWADQDLPRPGQGVDSFGGWTLVVDQFWFGHLARKRTWLYIVGCSPADLPPLPFKMGRPDYVVRYHDNEVRKAKGLKILGHKEREATPAEFAFWLVELAIRCRKCQH